jgi:hypothetical protein
MKLPRRLRMKAPGRPLILLALGLASAAALADEGMRCGSRIIEIGATQAEVLAQCGEPTARSVDVQDVHSGNRVVGTTEVHRWTYESYSAKRVLVFDQDRLRSIE